MLCVFHHFPCIWVGLLCDICISLGMHVNTSGIATHGWYMRCYQFAHPWCSCGQEHVEVMKGVWLTELIFDVLLDIDLLEYRKW